MFEALTVRNQLVDTSDIEADCECSSVPLPLSGIFGYQGFDAFFEQPVANYNQSTERLMEAIKPVVLEDSEYQYREESVPIASFRKLGQSSFITQKKPKIMRSTKLLQKTFEHRE